MEDLTQVSRWNRQQDTLKDSFIVVSTNDSGDLRGVAGGDGKLGCLCGKAGTSHLCNGYLGVWSMLLYTTTLTLMYCPSK